MQDKRIAMRSFIGHLDEFVKSISKLGTLPTDCLYKMAFCSLAKAGLALFGATNSQMAELKSLVERTLPPPYRGLLNGEMYLSALKFVRSLKDFLKVSTRRPVILREASINSILDFLRRKVGKVDGVIVLDCGSIPEMSTIAAKFVYLNRSVTFYEEVFINPVGVTRFLTNQLTQFGREAALRYYAELLRKELRAKFCIKISTIDVTVHSHGVTISSFLNSLNMKEVFEKISDFARQNSLLLTADHGYDIVVDEHGLYVTHGYEGESPLNFSRVAFFLVVD